MAITINGTTGVAGVDGSASTPAVQGSDTNTGVSFASDTVNINTGGSTRATVDSSGNLTVNEGNLNVSKPATPTVLVQNSTDTSFSTVKLQQSSGSGGYFAINKLGTNSSATGGANAAQIWQSGNAPIIFGVNNAERMRITSDDILIGTTTANAGHSNQDKGITLSATNGYGMFSRNEAAALYVSRNNSTGQGVRFNYNSSQAGEIVINSGSVSYNTSSDYRLKENVTSISDGITRLKTLKPLRFNFKADKDTTVDGFLAHEVTAVPEAIHGTKDEVDSDNQPVYQSIDQSKLVPLLTAALQEAIAKIETLETKVAALEAT